MSKRQRLTGKSPSWNFTLYDFVQEEYGNVVKLENLVGCSAVVDTITVEIANVIRNASIYEVSCAGRLPVSKFMRFIGIKNSSKLTAVLACANHYQINVVLVDTISNFKPTVHLKQIYDYAKNANTPTIIVLKDIDDLFRQDKKTPFFDSPEKSTLQDQLSSAFCRLSQLHEKMYSEDVNWRHNLNMAAFVNELEYISRNPELMIWTILITQNPAPLFYEIDSFFQYNTLWTGNPQYCDIFTNIERAKILRLLFRKYFPSNCTLFENPADLLLFCKTFTGSCTFHQLELFVRERANRWKAIVPIQEMASLKEDDPRLAITDVMLCEDPRLRRDQSISLYPAHAMNVKKYFPCPPECVTCMQLRETS